MVPVALFLIAVLLDMMFNAVKPAVLIFSNIPLAASGGIVALFARGMSFSISAGVAPGASSALSVVRTRTAGGGILRHSNDMDRRGTGTTTPSPHLVWTVACGGLVGLGGFLESSVADAHRIDVETLGDHSGVSLALPGLVLAAARGGNGRAGVSVGWTLTTRHRATTPLSSTDHLDG